MSYRTKILGFLFVAALFATPADSSVWSAQGADAPLKIKKRPQASARGCSGSGRTVVKVTFDKAGKVTAATAIDRSGCGAFDASALKAALGIQFEPAKKNGVAVTTVRSVEYTYSIY